MQRFTDEPITAGNLTLRALREDDIPAIARACSDPLTQQWLPLPRPYTQDSARYFVTTMAVEEWESGQGLERAIDLDGEFMGVIGLKRTDWQSAMTEVGYWLAPWARGRGVMTRALCAITDWAIDSQGMGRVEVRVAPGNASSLAVVGRAGFVREGLLRRASYTHDGPVDLVVFSRIVDDPRP